MKSSLKASSIAALSLAALSAAPAAFAQGGGPFADVPTDHWAYAAVDKLQKQGIVIGYPDMTYGGKRSMTRYEFAVAIARLLDKLGTGATAPDLSNYVQRPELDAYAKKTDLDNFATKADLDNLRRLVNEFQTELTTLGVDLDATKKRLDALEGRVRAIENELKRVQIGGAVNLMVRGNNRRGNAGSVVDQDGYEVTEGRGSRGSILTDTRFLHDIDLNIKARLSDTATAETVINFGNYLPFLNSITSYSGARSDRAPFAGGGLVFPGQQVNQDEQQTIYKAQLSVPISIPRIGGIDISVGRVPIQFTPYTLKLIDTDAYFNNAKTDLGDIPVDGIKGSGKLGPVSITGFAAKTDPIKYQSNISSTITGTQGQYALFAGAGKGAYSRLDANNGYSGLTGGFRGNTVLRTDLNGAGTTTGNRPLQSAISPTRNGAMAVEQAGGVRATFGTSRFGTIGGTYITFAGTDAATYLGQNPGTVADRQNFDRVFLYGGDINVNVVGIGIVASFTQTNTGGTHYNTTNGVLNGTVDTKTKTKTDDENYAWDVAGTYAKKAFSLTGGYKEVRAFFGAPGYWDKIGSFTNPTDIKGFYVRGSYAFSPTFGFEAAGKFYAGTGSRVADGGLSKDDKIRNFKAGLRYGLTSASGVDAGIERTEYTVENSNGVGRGKPVEYFYNIGYGYSFNPSTSFKLLYQIIDYRDKGTGFDTINGMGGVGAAQFSVKF
jgi:hypothetical protein